MNLIKKIFNLTEDKKAPPLASLNKEIAIEQIINYLERMPEPDLVLQKLGLSRQELKKLETDDEIYAAIETRRDAVISTPWRLSDAENANGEWLYSVLNKHLELIIKNAWQALLYGYSVQEIIYYQDENGFINIQAVKDKPMEWFAPQKDGTLIFYSPNGFTPQIVDTQFKFLLTINNPSYKNIYGEALLARLYWVWFFRHNSWRFWMKFIERFADPLLLGKIYQPEVFVQTMQQLGYESIIGVSRDESIDAITPSMSGEFEKLENILVKRIQKLILGQTLTTDMNKTGSYAAAEVHNEVKELKRKSDLRLIGSAGQKIINALWQLNNFPLPIPQIDFSDKVGLEIDRANRDATLVNAGIIKLSKEYLMNNYDYKIDDFDIENKSSTELKMSAQQKFNYGQQLIENLIQTTTKQSKSPVPIHLIKKAILEAESPEQLTDNFIKLYHGNSNNEFRDLLERALFTADIIGYVASEKKVDEV